MDRIVWLESVPGSVDLGDGIYVMWDEDGRGLAWNHPKSRAWATLRFRPDPRSTGHELVSGGPNDLSNVTIAGSLLCPMGCGTHGVIERGRWRAC